MLKKLFEPIEILQFDSIKTFHGMTTKNGGISHGGFESLNLGLNSNDKKENVIQNYNIFFDALRIDKNRIVATHQTHSDHIVKIDSADEFKVYEDTDAFATNVEGITLMTYYADCTPLFFHDPVKHVIGMAHSGWKGTEKKIGVKMIDFLIANYNCKIDDIRVGIGPNISFEVYEVNKEFLYEFEDEDFFKKYFIEKNGHYFFDMVQSNKNMLIKRGVLEKNIELSNLCTYNNSELFFSFRRQGDESGRMSGFIRLG